VGGMGGRILYYYLAGRASEIEGVGIFDREKIER
jgi:hypothetical protein